MNLISEYEFDKAPLPSVLPKVSVMVAVYNSAPYLDKCVQSLLAQTYKNLEIILVDDGATDESPAMCDRYALEYPFIKAVHKPNGGLASTRNAGIAAATGDFLIFLDGDDWVEPTAYETLIRLQAAFDADAVICNYKQVYKDHVVDTTSDLVAVFEDGEALSAFITEDERFNIQNAAWNKMYRREFLGQNRFFEGRWYEDILFSCQVLSGHGTAVYTNRALVDYVVDRTGSYMNAGINKRILTDQIPSYMAREQYLKDIGRDDLADIHAFFFYKRMMIHYRTFYHSKDATKKSSLRALMKVIRSDKARRKRAMQSPVADRGQKVRLRLICFWPWLFVKASDLYDKWRRF